MTSGRQDLVAGLVAGLVAVVAVGVDAHLSCHLSPVVTIDPATHTHT